MATDSKHVSFTERITKYRQRMVNLIRYLEKGLYPKSIDTTERRVLRKCAHRTYFMQDKRLMYRKSATRSVRVLTTEEGIKDALLRCHKDGTGGHRGIGRTMAKIGANYHWKNMRNDVTELVKNCSECKRARELHTKAPQIVMPAAANDPLNLVNLNLNDLRNATSGADSPSDSRRVSFSVRFAKYKEEMDALRQYLEYSTYPETMKDRIKKRKLRRDTLKYCLRDNRLLYKKSTNLSVMAITSEEAVKYILLQFHNSGLGGHNGINRMMAKISAHYHWRGIKQDVIDFVMSCAKCQRFKKPKILTPKPKPIVATSPLQVVCMAIAGPYTVTVSNNQYVLIFLDYFTKFVDFYPLETKCPSRVAICIKSFISRWGAPLQLLSEQPRQFVAQVNDHVYTEFGFERIVTCAYRRYSSALGKRTSQSILSRLGQLAVERRDDWDAYLDDVAFSMRTEQHPTSKFTPFFLMFGRQARFPFEMDLEVSDVSLPVICGNVDDYVAARDAREERVCKQIDGGQKSASKGGRQQAADQSEDQEATHCIDHPSPRSEEGEPLTVPSAEHCAVQRSEPCAMTCDVCITTSNRSTTTDHQTLNSSRQAVTEKQQPATSNPVNRREADVNGDVADGIDDRVEQFDAGRARLAVPQQDVGNVTKLPPRVFLSWNALQRQQIEHSYSTEHFRNDENEAGQKRKPEQSDSNTSKKLRSIVPSLVARDQHYLLLKPMTRKELLQTIASKKTTLKTIVTSRT